MIFSDSCTKILVNSPYFGYKTVFNYLLHSKKGITQYNYNAFNEIISTRLPSGSIVTYVRDSMGRLVTRIEPEGTTSWEYDTASNGLGLISKVKSSTVNKVFKYDAFSRETQVRNNFLLANGSSSVYSVSTAYDAFGRMNTQNYPGNVSVYNCFNNNAYLISVSLDDPTCSSSFLWKALDYDASNNILSEQDKNGIVTTYELNPFGQVTSIKTQNNWKGSATATTTRSLSYQYDAKKNLISKIDRDFINNLDNIQSYEYDELDRMSDVTQFQRSTIAPTLSMNVVKHSSWAYDSIGMKVYLL